MIGGGGETRVQLGLNRLRDQIPRALAQQIRQRVRALTDGARSLNLRRHVVINLRDLQAEYPKPKHMASLRGQPKVCANVAG